MSVGVVASSLLELGDARFLLGYQPLHTNLDVAIELGGKRLVRLAQFSETQICKVVNLVRGNRHAATDVLSHDLGVNGIQSLSEELFLCDLPVG